MPHWKTAHPSDMHRPAHKITHTLKRNRKLIGIGLIIPTVILLLRGMVWSPEAPSRAADQGVPLRDFTVIRAYPHDKDAFTQGLVFHNGYLYESTGLYGRSSLRKVDVRTGQVKQIHRLDHHLFGEGATLFNEKLYQLTWKAGKGLIYDVDSFNRVGTFHYPFEGWGITHDEANLILSNGTSRLFFYDPESLQPVKHITVSSNNKPIQLLNELEYIDGKIYANIWRSDNIIAIDPDTGQVMDWYNLSGLRNQVPGAHQIGVLNGIAFDRQRNRLFVTGKFWPTLFEIELR